MIRYFYNFRIFLYLYIVIISVAFLVELLGDRSFGAVMLSSLPIALLALLYLLVGPWLSKAGKKAAFGCWIVGALIILLIGIFFIQLGREQARDGELLFTYAILIMSFPASLLLPFAVMLTERIISGDIIQRVAFSWIICVLAGALQWRLAVVLQLMSCRWHSKRTDKIKEP